MPTPDAPQYDWESHVFVHCGWLSCCKCGNTPDVLWAWDDIPSGEDAAWVFTARVVPYLQQLGWTLDNTIASKPDDGLLCPACSNNQNSN